MKNQTVCDATLPVRKILQVKMTNHINWGQEFHLTFEPWQHLRVLYFHLADSSPCRLAALQPYRRIMLKHPTGSQIDPMKDFNIVGFCLFASSVSSYLSVSIYVSMYLCIYVSMYLCI